MACDQPVGAGSQCCIATALRASRCRSRDLPPPLPPLPTAAADLLSRPRAKLAGPGDDPWLAPDKLQHFAFCAAVTAGGYLAARRSERLRRHRLLLGAAAGVVAGVLKEVGDVLQVRLQLLFEHLRCARCVLWGTCSSAAACKCPPPPPPLVQWWPGALSIRDLGADAVGVAAALAALVAAEARRRPAPAGSRPPPPAHQLQVLQAKGMV